MKLPHKLNTRKLISAIGEVYIFLIIKKCMLRFCMLCPVRNESANSICVVAMGAIHFLVCVTPVAHTFLIWRKNK